MVECGSIAARVCGLLECANILSRKKHICVFGTAAGNGYCRTADLGHRIASAGDERLSLDFAGPQWLDGRAMFAFDWNLPLDQHWWWRGDADFTNRPLADRSCTTGADVGYPLGLVGSGATLPATFWVDFLEKKQPAGD